MILNKLQRMRPLVARNVRTFAQLQNWETSQPAAVGTVDDCKFFYFGD